MAWLSMASLGTATPNFRLRGGSETDRRARSLYRARPLHPLTVHWGAGLVLASVLDRRPDPLRRYCCRMPSYSRLALNFSAAFRQLAASEKVPLGSQTQRFVGQMR